ncbi:MAG: imidazole glycerol phosphate synthase subunit HisH [Phycisphaerales bacterium]|nr:imidazole glycerol phosphate synthase subunit HisH [Phycisphaerales bacterium]
MTNSTRTAAIVGTGSANLASVQAALARAEVGSRITDSCADVLQADLVVLPGVGAFGPAMRALESSGLGDAIRSRVSAGRPLLAICLGLQLLCEESEESPGVKGLGLLSTVVTRFPAHARTPQLGWNLVEPSRPEGLVGPGYAYFANSFKIDSAPPGWSPSWADHAGRFVAAIERGPVLACQFHPELSGAWGLRVLMAWARAAARGTEVTC